MDKSMPILVLIMSICVLFSVISMSTHQKVYYGTAEMRVVEPEIIYPSPGGLLRHIEVIIVDPHEIPEEVEYTMSSLEADDWILHRRYDEEKYIYMEFVKGNNVDLSKVIAMEGE